jgi:hypothetical protein
MKGSIRPMTTPDGQITCVPELARVYIFLIFLQKYSDFQKSQISLCVWTSHPDRGALANVINVGRAAVDAEGAFDKGT